MKRDLNEWLPMNRREISEPTIQWTDFGPGGEGWGKGSVITGTSHIVFSNGLPYDGVF